MGEPLVESPLRRLGKLFGAGVYRRGTRAIQTVVRTLLAGAAVCVPLAITAAAVYWAGAQLNSLAFGAATGMAEWGWLAPWKGHILALKKFLADFPGVGVVAILLLIYLVGLGMRFWLFAKGVSLMEAILVRVPLVKTVYGSIRDMMRFFGGDGSVTSKVVLYKLPGQDVRMLALLTNEHPIGLPAHHAKGMVAIWLPMSYQLGGYMLYVPAEAIEPIEMSVEQLMKLAATAEIGSAPLPSQVRGGVHPPAPSQSQP